jgi:hypothetical protein
LKHEFRVAHVTCHNPERVVANIVNDDSGGFPLFIHSGLNENIVEVGDCVVGCVADENSDGELIVDSNTCQSDFDSSIACKRICQRVKSLDGLPSKRGQRSFSSLMIAMNFFFK